MKKSNKEFALNLFMTNLREVLHDPVLIVILVIVDWVRLFWNDELV